MASLLCDTLRSPRLICTFPNPDLEAASPSRRPVFIEKDFRDYNSGVGWWGWGVGGEGTPCLLLGLFAVRIRKPIFLKVYITISYFKEQYKFLTYLILYLYVFVIEKS